MNKELWDIAIEQRDKNGIQSKHAETSVMVIGSKSSGKTSMIQGFLDKADEAHKPTVALEYRYCRRSRGANMAKEIGHIWELGGGTWLHRLIDTSISHSTIRTMSLVLVVDLSKPEQLWFTLEKLLYQATVCIKQITSEDHELERELNDHAWSRMPDDHPDRKRIEPFPIPLAIIGSKYDKFQAMDEKSRDVICKTLRYVALTKCATLAFFSSKNKTLLKQTKSLFNNLLFFVPLSQPVEIDHNKALFVPVGCDQLSKLGNPPSEEKSDMVKPLDERWRDAFMNIFPQQHVSDPSMAQDPSRDAQYAEKAIDDLRKQKTEELDRYRRLSERRMRELQQQAVLEGAI